MRKRFFNNTFWSFVEAAVALGTSLAVARAMIHWAGIEFFGIFLALSLFSSYGVLNLLDFGMGGAVTTFVARYGAIGTKDLKKLWSFSAVYFFFISCLAALVGGLIFYFFETGILHRLSTGGVSTGVLLPTLLLVFLTFFSGLVDSFLRGLNDIANMQRINILLHFVRLAGILGFLNLRFPLSYIMWWLNLAMLLRLGILYHYLRVRHPGVSGWDRFSYEDAAQWMRYSFTLFVSSITGFVFNIVDRLIIITYMPAAALANFDIASKAQNIVRGGLSVLLTAVVPVSAHFHALGQLEKLREMFIRGTNLANMALMPVLVYATVTVGTFIRLWVGPEHVWLAPLACAILSFLYFNVAPSLGNTMLVGMGMARLLVPIQIVSTLLNLGISVALVRDYGLKGLVAGTLVGYSVSSVWLMMVLWKVLNFDKGMFWHRILQPYLLMVAVPAALALPLYFHIFAFNIAGYLGCGVLFVAVCYALYYLIVLSSDEKTLFRGYSSSLVARMRSV